MKNTDLTLSHQPTRTTPPAGEVIMYAKSDDKIYKLDSAGTEEEIGTGSGGGGLGQNWTAYTPDITSGALTNVTLNGFEYLHTDRFCYVRGQIECTGTPAGIFKLGLPSGLTADPPSGLGSGVSSFMGGAVLRDISEPKSYQLFCDSHGGDNTHFRLTALENDTTYTDFEAYTTFRNNYPVPLVSGDNIDVFVCIPVAQLGSGVVNYGERSRIFGEKILSADVTSDGVIADLTFTGLTIGRDYEFKLSPYMFYTDTNVAIKIYNGATQLSRASAGTDRVMYGTSVRFTATSTTLTFESVSVGSDSIGGDGTKNQTWAQLIEYYQPDQVVGESEYTDLTGGWVTLSADAASVDMDITALVNGRDFDDIEVEWWAARGDVSTGATRLLVEFNGDTTHTNYFTQNSFGDNGSGSNSEANRPDIAVLGSSEANRFAHNVITFPDFRSTDKLRQAQCVSNAGVTSSRAITGSRICVHNSQTAALTSIRWVGAVDIGAGSKYRVFGVKKGNKGGGVVIDSPKLHPTVSKTATNTLQVSAGQLASDELDNQGMIKLNTSMSGTLNNTWVKGAGNGKTHGGAASNGNFYRVYLALLDDGSVDWIAAEKSVSLSTIKTTNGISRLAWTGVEREYSSGDILDFIHYPKTATVIFDETAVDDYNNTSPPTSFALLIVTCPPDCVYLGRFGVRTDTAGDLLQVIEGDKSNENGARVCSVNEASVVEYKEWEVPVDSQSRIKHRFLGTGTVSLYRIMRRGYKYR